MRQVQLLTKHGLVLLCLSRQPASTMRRLAYDLGVTVGTVRRVLDDLEEAGYIRRERVGRQNVNYVNYCRSLDEHVMLRREVSGRCPSVGEVLQVLNGDDGDGQETAPQEEQPESKREHGLLRQLATRLHL